MEGHLLAFMMHWVQDRQGRNFRMVSFYRSSYALAASENCKVALVYSGRDILWWLCTQNLSAGQRNWKPPWFYKCMHLASFRYLVLLPLVEIWYSQSIFLWPISVSGLILVYVEGVWVGRSILSIRAELYLVVGSILCVGLSIGVSTSGVYLLQFLSDSSGSSRPLPHSFCTFNLPIFSTMVRPCGISCRGSLSAARGGSRGRGGSGPRRISPLASVPLDSLPSDHSDPSLNSSFHSARFKFKSKLNKPTISAIITVVFSEEEDETTSSVETSKERSLSPNSTDSQGSKASDVLNNPVVLQEEAQQEDSRHQQESSHEEIIACAPAQFSGSVLHLVTPPGCNMMDVEDNVMVHWVSSPSKANENDTDLPPQE